MGGVVAVINSEAKGVISGDHIVTIYIFFAPFYYLINHRRLFYNLSIGYFDNQLTILTKRE